MLKRPEKDNPYTQMTICFSAEMQIESKNCNISIFIFSKIETKTSNTNVLLFFFFSFKLWESKMWNSFLIVLDIKFVNWLMVNDYLTVIGYQAFIAKYSYVIDLTLHGLLIIHCSFARDWSNTYFWFIVILSLKT